MDFWERFAIGCAVALVIVVLSAIERAIKEGVSVLHQILYHLKNPPPPPPRY